MDRRTFLAKGIGLLMGGLVASHVPVSAELLSPLVAPFPHIALIIDDIGFSLRRAERFLTLDIPITFSILPRVCWSVESALTLHAEGHEIMLHQPMEPFDATVDPGPGAIFVDDRQAYIQQVLTENINALPHVVGVNNHMGSKYTQKPEKMGQALDVVRSHGLFFIDSMTTGHSTAYACARQMGVSTKRRDLFLDNPPDADAVVRQMKRLRIRAHKHGRAIGIGHPRPETVEGIMRFLDTPESRDVAFTYISKMMDRL